MKVCGGERMQAKNVNKQKEEIKDSTLIIALSSLDGCFLSQSLTRCHQYGEVHCAGEQAD